MVFQLILAGILLLVVIVYFAVVYWQITLTIIGAIAFFWWWHSRRKKSVKEEQYNSDEQYEHVEPEAPSYEKCFEVLHLNQNATWHEVKEQYRRFVQMYHPDTTSIRKKQSAEKFILVTRAKDVLEERFRSRKKKNSES